MDLQIFRDGGGARLPWAATFTHVDQPSSCTGTLHDYTPPHRLRTLSVSCIVFHRTASLASGHMSRLAEHVAGWSCASTGTIVSFDVSPQYFRRCMKPRQTI